MALRGGDDCFGGWFGGFPQETTNERSVTSQNHYLPSQNHYMWDPTWANNSLYTTTTTSQPQSYHLLQSPTLQSQTMQSLNQNHHLAGDLRYNQVNRFSQYGLHLNTGPESLESGLSRLSLSTPSRLSDQFLGTTTSDYYGFQDPSFVFNHNDFQPAPYPIENQIQSGSRIRFHARNPVSPFEGGLEDLRLRHSFENNHNHQYRNNIQNVSRRNSYPELNRPVGATCPSCLNNTTTSNGGLSRPRGRNQFSSLELGSQRSGGRSSVNGSGCIDSNASLSSLFDITITSKPRSHHSYSLEELRGRVCLVSRDPQARGFLEEKVVNRDQAYIDLIFSEVQDDLCDLIVDHSANHLMQKLVGGLNEDQMTKFIILIVTSERKFLGICDDSYGTYVMQRLLEVPLTRGQKSLLVSALKNVAGILSKTQHGHHVIMHCLRRFSNDITVELVEEIVVNCVDLATNKSGCCVLQHCLEHVRNGEQKERLVTEIVANALILSGDAFGNYVVQNVLDNVPQVINELVAQLAGNYFVLSMSRFGSNVVEKCLKNADEERSIAIMLEILSHHDILELVKDNYGNYVVQSIWKLSQGRPFVRETLFKLIQTNCLFLKSHMYGRRVVEAIMGKRK